MQSVWNAVAGITAVIAIALTNFTIWLQRRTNRDQTYLRLHEILMGDEMREGRSMLIEAGKTGKLPSLNTPEHRKMTHALGGLDTAGIYIDHDLMSRKRFIEVWHHNLRAMRAATDLMAKERVDVLEGWWPWPHLWALFDAAATFRDPNMICCQREGRWPHPTRHLIAEQQDLREKSGR
jgi:hypothetical protein